MKFEVFIFAPFLLVTDTGRYLYNKSLDVGQILQEAQHRWFRPDEICEILRNHQKFGLTPQPPLRPPGGSLYLFDRKVLPYFCEDGHQWRKEEDGKAVKEIHEKLKAGSNDVLHCYYAHGEDNENFQRRSYWMLEEPMEHIILVHYREVKEGYIVGASCLQPVHPGLLLENPQSSSAPCFESDLIVQESHTSTPSSVDWKEYVLSSELHSGHAKRNEADPLLVPAGLVESSRDSFQLNSRFSSLLSGEVLEENTHIAPPQIQNISISQTVVSPDTAVQISSLEGGVNSDEAGSLKKFDSYVRWMDREKSRDCDESLMATKSGNYWNTLDTDNEGKSCNLSIQMEYERKRTDTQLPLAPFGHSSFQYPFLSKDIITEILIRLPVKLIVKFRCVSKSWRALITSPKFVKDHLRLALKNKAYHKVMWCHRPQIKIEECYLSSLFDNSTTFSDVSALHPRLVSDGLYTRVPDSIVVLGSVHGLICLIGSVDGCIFQGYDDIDTERLVDIEDFKEDLFLWNPSTRRYKKLPDHKPDYWFDTRVYGLGYDMLHDDYKFLGTFRGYQRLHCCKVQLYSLKSDSWKSLDDLPSALSGGNLQGVSGTFVEGSLHWLSYTTDGPDKRWNIISFNLADEKWGTLEKPCYEEGELVLWLGVIGSDLSLFVDCEGTHIDVWVMQKYAVQGSWNKKFIIKYPDGVGLTGFGPLFMLPYFFSITDEILMLFNSTANIYNTRDEVWRPNPYVINWLDHPTAFIYVESLVSPFSAKGTEATRKNLLDVAADPTLPHTISVKCPQSDHKK